MRYYTYVGQDNRKINLKILNRDMLKYIALILMACGHMIIYVGVSSARGIPDKNVLFLSKRKPCRE